MTTCELTYKRSNPNELSARLAGKLVAIILTLTLVIGLLMCGIDRAFAGTVSAIGAAPRADVMVSGENVRLGDVFDGLDKNGQNSDADFVLAPAPAPGQELVWNEPTLLRIATAFNLPWRPEQGAEIRIRRAASLVDSATLKSVVRDHLATLDSRDSFNVSFTSDIPEVIVPGQGMPGLKLADFNMQSSGGTFSAIVKISDAQGTPVQTLNLRGVAERTVQLPVLKSGFKNGDIITPDDITWTSQKATLLRADYVRDPEILIGSTPRRNIVAGEVVRADALEKPRMVNRGDLVTMVYNQNGMYLTVTGRALEDGASGQAIKVSNSNSSRTVTARVTNVKEVTVN